MGQLERYGLYVLVLVIFLILGVAIWGNDPADSGAVDHRSDVRETLRANDPGELVGRNAQTRSDALRNKFEFTEIAPPSAADRAVETDGAASAKRIDEPIGVVNDAAQLLSDFAASEEGEAGGSEIAASARALRDYTIKPGDTLSEISQQFYGTQKYWELIRLQNPNIDPMRLVAGTVIQVPHPDAVTGAAAKADARNAKARDANAPKPGVASTYVVKKGDSLSVISTQVYGTSKHAALIQKANGIKDPKQIKPGDRLEIPALPQQTGAPDKTGGRDTSKGD